MTKSFLTFQPCELNWIFLQPQYFGSFHAAEQLFDALTTWELIGELDVTDLSLKFFRQFDQNIEIGTYVKGSEVYESLTYAITIWAEAILIFLRDRTPDDYILSMAFDRTTGEPVGPRGTIHCLSAALSAYGAYNGLIPPSWAHGGRLTKGPWNGTTCNDHQQIGSGADSQFSVGSHRPMEP